MLKNQVHPAGIRSKKLIINSLLKLMDEIPYEKITIKEIANQATLTRRTFYAHFKTKEEVLDYKISQLNEQLTTIIASHTDKSHREIALLYFDFWVDHVGFLMLMKRHNLIQLMFENFDKNIREIRSYFGCSLSEQDIRYADYSSAFFTGVLSSIMDRWIATGAKESANELVELLEQIAIKFSSSFQNN